MVSKIKLKKKNGMVLPIAVMVLLGVLIGSVLLSKMNSSSGKTVINLSQKNQSSNYNSVGLSYAINWLEKNKNNLNADNAVIYDNNSKVILSYYANGYFYNNKTNPRSTVITRSNAFLYDSTSISNIETITNNANLGFINTILIFRMCKFSDASPGDMVGTEENKCLKDNLILANAGGGTSSAGYGGYEYTVSPSSDKIVYIIFVSTGRLGGVPIENINSAITLTETMISM